MKLGVNTNASIITAKTPTSRSTTASLGSDTFFGTHFQTVNSLDALHIEAENIAASEAVTIMEMRILDAVSINKEQTRDELAAAFSPERKHVAWYAIDCLFKRRFIEKWRPGRTASERSKKKAICYRLTSAGEKEAARLLATLDPAFGSLLKTPNARRLAAGLKKSAV